MGEGEALILRENSGAGAVGEVGDTAGEAAGTTVEGSPTGTTVLVTMVVPETHRGSEVDHLSTVEGIQISKPYVKLMIEINFLLDSK